MIRWDAVTGAETYTLERAEFSSLPTANNIDSAQWRRLESVEGTRYEDRDSSLRAGYYYAYRVTANSGLETLHVPGAMTLEGYADTSFTQADHEVAVYVEEGSWADQNFDSVFSGAFAKNYSN